MSDDGVSLRGPPAAATVWIAYDEQAPACRLPAPSLLPSLLDVSKFLVVLQLDSHSACRSLFRVSGNVQHVCVVATAGRMNQEDLYEHAAVCIDSQTCIASGNAQDLPVLVP